MTQTGKRFRSLVVVLSLVAGTNLAISRIADKSGVAAMPDSPRPKSGVAAMPDSPRPKSGVAAMLDSPRPKSGVAAMPDSPRP